jgi:hypothetical protein
MKEKTVVFIEKGFKFISGFRLTSYYKIKKKNLAATGREKRPFHSVFFLDKQSLYPDKSGKQIYRHILKKIQRFKQWGLKGILPPGLLQEAFERKYLPFYFLRHLYQFN